MKPPPPAGPGTPLNILNITAQPRPRSRLCQQPLQPGAFAFALPSDGRPGASGVGMPPSGIRWQTDDSEERPGKQLSHKGKGPWGQGPRGIPASASESGGLRGIQRKTQKIAQDVREELKWPQKDCRR